MATATHTVTYNGPKDKTDGTTQVEVDVDGKTYLFARDNPVAEVPAAVVQRLERDDLKQHRFETEAVEVPAAAEPTAGFDELNVEAVLELLAKSDAEQISAIKAYESQHKQRKTVLDFEPATTS